MNSLSKAGFTIIEILAVMAIISILLGLSAAALMRAGDGQALDVAERQVRATLARVRSASRERSALGEVVLLPGEGLGDSRVRVQTTRDAGSWHFDDEGGRQLGGRNNFARLQGASIVDGGTVRSAAQFKGSGKVTCGRVPGYDPTVGFDLSFDVQLDAESEGGPLCSFGEAFSLEVDEDGALSAAVQILLGSKPIVATSEKGVIAPGTWARVRMAWDGIELMVWAHGVLEGRERAFKEGDEDQTPRLLINPSRQALLTFGGRGFVGMIDEVMYRTVEAEEILDLAEGNETVRLALQSPMRVRFDSEGRLDRRVHEGEVVIRVVTQEGESRQIRIDMTGVIR
ncbi:MAG: hypothetical protein CMJ83_13445 [Planctomycetes bacterium]|nr:hypothetical protein [Planctomycetota bacterium]